MAAALYLAMTAAEFLTYSSLPQNAAWMACHFSPYSTGLTNLPQSLPSGALLILNDRIPFSGHDLSRIAEQLRQTVDTLSCMGVLLDFQQPDVPMLAHLAEDLVGTLPCPVAVPDNYAHGIDCPVFLPPCPHHTPLSEHLAPWQGRELWLDLASDSETLTLTPKGAHILPLPLGELPEGGHWDPQLHCHYRTETGTDFARFTLWRTKEDLETLAKEAEQLGIKTMVGLYQELKNRSWVQVPCICDGVCNDRK